MGPEAEGPRADAPVRTASPSADALSLDRSRAAAAVVPGRGPAGRDEPPSDFAHATAALVDDEALGLAPTLASAPGGSPPAFASDPLIGRLAGHYELTRLLGRGGMGAVYRAETPEGALAAVKVLGVADEGGVRARFELEARTRIDHPNVVQVLGAGALDDGRPYIAFELLEGLGVEVWLRRRPPPAEVIELGLQVCQGLSAAHALGVIHRDLKPANLFRTEDGRFKILDFGVARHTADAVRLTQTGLVVGTPCYLAPEQARGESGLDGRADVFALGVVLYEALSGRTPFLRDSTVATMLATIMDQPEPLDGLRDDLPSGLSAVIERALAKDRRRRFASAAELAEALRAVAQGRMDPSPTGATRPSIPPGERRLVAVLLARGVVDLPALDRAVRGRGGALVPLLGEQALGLFGAHAWEGDEVACAVAAGREAEAAAARLAVASGHAAASTAGAGIFGAALDAAEAALAAAPGAGLVIDTRAAALLDGAHPTRPAGPGILSLAPEALGPSGSGAPNGSAAAVPGRPPSGALGLDSDPRLSPARPLIGRDGELALLAASWRSTVEDERAQVVWILGPPGIGKSQLRREAANLILPGAPDGGAARLFVARGEPRRRGRDLGLAAALLEGRVRTAEDQAVWPELVDGRPPAERFAAVDALVAEAIEDPLERRAVASFLAPLLDAVPPDGAEWAAARADPLVMRDRIRAAVLDYFEALTEDGAPLALLVDDLQWADDASLALLEALVERLEDRALWLLVTARPELPEARPDCLSGRSPLRLEPRGLGRGDVGRLAAAIAGAELPAPLIEALTERTGGNPLFVEQLVRSLLDRDVLDGLDLDRLPLPLSVEAAVQSRLDHLPAAEKELLKRAAVISREFVPSELEALGMGSVESLLASLRQRDLVTARTRTRTTRTREYRFRTRLVADVAYGMLTDELSAELHRRFAAWLEAAPGAEPEEIALHHERGGARPQAGRWYTVAAIRLAERADGAGIDRCAERALALGVPDELAFELHMARSDAFEYLGRGEDQAEALGAATRAARSSAEKAKALAELAWRRFRTGRTARALADVDEAIGAARRAGDPEVLALALGRKAVGATYAGRLDDARRALDEVRRMSTRLSLVMRASAAGWIGQLATAEGDLDGRKRAFEHADQLYCQAGAQRRAAGARANVADVLNRVGRYRDAIAALEDAIALCKKLGNRRMEAYALANLGYALGMLGERAAARDALGRVAGFAAEAGESRLEVYAALYGLRVDLGEAPPAELAERAEACAEAARGLELPGVEISALAHAAAARLAAGELEAAEARSAEALARLEAVGSVEEDEAEVFLRRAEVLEALGRHEDAAAVVRRGHARIVELSRRIGDLGLREPFLNEVPAHRALGGRAARLGP